MAERGHLRVISNEVPKSDEGDEPDGEALSDGVAINFGVNSQEDMDKLAAVLTEMGPVIIKGSAEQRLLVLSAVSTAYREFVHPEGDAVAVVFAGFGNIKIQGGSRGNLGTIVTAATFRTAIKQFNVEEVIPDYAVRRRMRAVDHGEVAARPGVAIELSPKNNVVFSSL